MAGGTMRHNLIIQNVAFALRSLRGRGCQVFTENVKLEVTSEAYYVYPDVVLTCQARDLADNRLIRFPSLIVEVLSESTEAHDRGQKLDHYLRMPSLQAYILLSQQEVFAAYYQRRGDFWAYQALSSPAEVLRVEALDWEISLSQIYEDILLR